MSRSNPATTHSNAGIAAWNFKLATEIHSYEDADRFYRASSIDLSDVDLPAALGPNMDVIQEDDGASYVVRLYATKIIRYYADETFSVDNGGFATPTTRERLQAVVPDGFVVAHCAKQLGLYGPKSERGYLSKLPGALWPLDHSRRITTEGDFA